MEIQEITKHDFLEAELTSLLKETRTQDGLQLAEIVEIIKKVFAPVEIDILIKDL